VLTRKGKACVEAGRATIENLEDEITRRLGQRGHHQLRRMLQKLLDAE
jgi:DNA-binding MarR family transcriptional regulator